MTQLIFLGAGASRPFGIPTMTEMVQKFEKYLQDNGIPEKYLYSQVKDSLTKAFNTERVDIESIFSVIDGIASEIEPKKMDYFSYYYISRFGIENKFPDNEIRDAKKLKNHLEKFVIDECSIKIDNTKLKEIWEESFHPLFLNLPSGSISTNDEGYTYTVYWKAYTTNYDLMFENYWNTIAPIHDFFDKNLSIPTFDPTKSLGEMSFVKLHGSIDWIKLKNRKIIKAKYDTPTLQDKEGTVMLYPIQQKDLYLRPYLTLFSEFKHGLEICQNWYVIGYAFNDPFITEIFKEALTESKKLIIINPHAKKIKNDKFPKEYHDRIIALPIRFGGKYFARQLIEFNLQKRNVIFDISTESTDFLIEYDKKAGLVEVTKGDFNLSDNKGNPNVLICSSRKSGDKKCKIQIKFPFEVPFENDIKIKIASLEHKSFVLIPYFMDRAIAGYWITDFIHNSETGRYDREFTIPSNSLFVT